MTFTSYFLLPSGRSYWQLPKGLLLSTVRAMAVALSSGQKALESPFCHKELFGTDHPLAKGRHKSKSKSLKLSKRKLKASSKSSSSTCTSSSLGHIKKKGIAPKPKAASSSVTTDRGVHTEPQDALRMGRSVAKQSPHPTVSTEARTDEGVRKWKTGVGRSASMHSVPSTAASHRSVRSSASSGLLSLGSLEQKLKSSIVGAAVNVRFNKTVTNANLPPHLRVPRRAFESSADGQGRGKSAALSIADVAAGLGRLLYRRVIVMSGAGISTSSGIPDFRTPGTGLYDNLRQYHIPEPTAIFDIDFFGHNPRPFFTLAKELYPGRYAPNPVHRFIRLLQDKGLLLRNYTQNIDGLERLAGVRPGKLVEAHGSFTTASCTRCKAKQDPEEVKAAIFRDRIPRCKHKYCTGVVKPDIVFFGEDLPQRFHSLQLPDFSHCDLLIIMGTSLEVEPFASLVSLPRFDVPRVLINREVVGPFKRSRQRLMDVVATGDLVESVRSLAEQAGWLSELEELGTEEREEGRDATQEQPQDSKENVSPVLKSVSQDSETTSTVSEQDSESLRSETNSDPEKKLCSAISALTLESDAPSTKGSKDSWHVEEAFAEIKSEKK